MAREMLLVGSAMARETPSARSAVTRETLSVGSAWPGKCSVGIAVAREMSVCGVWKELEIMVGFYREGLGMATEQIWCLQRSVPIV